MKVTFLLGNGFDKSIGLDTGYRDFYEWYLKQPSESEEVQRLKEEIEKDIQAEKGNWSDFELALGQFTAEFDNRDKFISCFKSARKSLITYLRQVYENEKFKDSDFLMSAAYRLDELSQNFYKDFKANEKARFEDVGNNEDVVIDYVSFNYTPFLKDGYSDMKSFARGLWEQLHKGREYKIGDFINVHGLLDNEPILGVNDIFQIANENFRNDKEILELMVKSEADKKANLKWREKACEMIQNSDIVCIFGMSLGDTDLFWWGQLAKWFEKDTSHELVIFGRNKKKEKELREKISKHMLGKGNEADIIVDCTEKKMTVKFAHMAANAKINLEPVAKAVVCNVAEVKTL